MLSSFSRVLIKHQKNMMVVCPIFTAVQFFLQLPWLMPEAIKNCWTQKSCRFYT